MTSVAIRTLIKDTLAATLPALLSAAGLDDFDDYISGPTRDEEKKELAVYKESSLDATDQAVLSYTIQCQLTGVLDPDLYDDIILPVIREKITPSLIDIERRDQVGSDVWPADVNRATSFIYYSLIFNQSLDDCDF